METQTVEAIRRVLDKLMAWRDYALLMEQDTRNHRYGNEAHGYQLLIADLELALNVEGYNIED